MTHNDQAGIKAAYGTAIASGDVEEIERLDAVTHEAPKPGIAAPAEEPKDSEAGR